MTAALYPTHPDDGDANAPPYFGNLCERDRANGGSGDAARACRRATARPGRRGCGAIPRSVLISETASAPCASAAAATSAGDAQLGVSLTISGFVVRARTASSSAATSAGSAPNIRPVLTFGQETLSSSAVTSGRSATVSTSRPDLVVRVAHHVDDQRHRQPRELRQILGQEALEALVREPDRVQQSTRQLVQPRWRIALARSDRDGLGHEGREGKVGQEGVTKRTVSGDCVEGS